MSLKEEELRLKYAVEEGKLNVDRSKAVTEAENSRGELEIKRAEYNETAVPESVDRAIQTLDQTKVIAEGIEKTMESAAKQFGLLADKIEAQNGPKKISLKRGTDGKIMSAEVR